MPDDVLKDEAAIDSTADAAEPSPADSAEEIRREREALQDRLLRTAAEFDNFRKRVNRERREQAESAASDLLLELLPIIDNFERALQAPAEVDVDAHRKGIEMIHKQMLDLLRRRGVKLIDALGADFDPKMHQAVVHELSNAHREGEVMQELQRGYMLGDRLLRPAMVKVAKSGE